MAEGIVEKQILKNDFLQIEYSKDALRSTGLTPAGNIDP
jgi:hypothetical protein